MVHFSIFPFATYEENRKQEKSKLKLIKNKYKWNNIS